MKLSDDEQAELRALISAPSTPAATATRATNVLLRGRGVTRGPIAMQCSVSLPTVDRCVHRCAEYGIAGLSGQPRSRIQIPDRVRSRILELAASPPPADTRPTRWTRRTLADHLQRIQDITVSNNCVATVPREAGVRLIDPSRA